MQTRHSACTARSPGKLHGRRQARAPAEAIRRGAVRAGNRAGAPSLAPLRPATEAQSGYGDSAGPTVCPHQHRLAGAPFRSRCREDETTPKSGASISAAPAAWSRAEWAPLRTRGANDACDGASRCPTSPACPERCQQAETATGSKPGAPPRERLDQLLELTWIRGMGRWHAAVGRPRLNSYPVGVAAPSSPPWHSPYPDGGCVLRWGGRLPPSRSAFSTPVAGRNAAAPTLQRGAVSAVTARRARGRGWPRLHGGCAQARRPSAQCGGGSGRVCEGCSPRSLALEPLARSASPPPTR